MKKIYQITLMGFAFFLFSKIASAQVEFKVALQPDKVTYVVSLRSAVSYTPPQNLTSTAQVSIKVPTGSFELANLQTLQAETAWENNARFNAPDEDPDHDYFTFGLTTLGTNGFNYVANEELPLFQFENIGSCTGAMELIDNATDPFLPPNSQNANVGNQITIAGAQGDAYVGNYDLGNADCQARPCPISATITTNMPSDCDTNDGQITIVGVDESVVEISINNAVSFSPITDFTDLGPGSYNIWMRYANDGGCPTAHVDNPIILTAPTAPTVDDIEITEPTGCDASNGTINIIATGNQLEYSIGEGFSSNPNFANLTAGMYDISVRNADNTCTVKGGMVELSGNDSPNITNVLRNNPSNCAAQDGTIEFEVEGDAADYEYSINGGGVWFEQSVFGNLTPGDYQLMVRNANNTCEIEVENVTLTLSNATNITDVISINPDDCNSNSGQISVEVENSEDILYSIDNGETWSESPTFTGLGAGSYRILIHNEAGDCTTQGPEISLTSPVAPEFEDVIAVVPSDCDRNDGTIEIFATGGTGRYEYSIDNGATWSMSNMFAGLGSGVYPLAIRNENGTCIVDHYNLHLLATDAPTFSFVNFIQPDGCNKGNGMISIEATGGQGDYEYSIDDGASWGSNSVFTGLSNDIYTPKIRNADGSCTVTFSDIKLMSDACELDCMLSFELIQNPEDGSFQVNVVSDTTWNEIERVTSTLQVTVVVPTGGFQIEEVESLVPNVAWSMSRVDAPQEYQQGDYISFGLGQNGTNQIEYVKGQHTPLFKFFNTGSCEGEVIYLMNNSTDPFASPNSRDVNVGQQLTTIGSGVDADVCIFETGAAPCAPIEPCNIDTLDSDLDGICDAQEEIDGTDPNNPCDPLGDDTDQDGICDVQEEIDGTDPLDPCDPLDTDTDQDGICDVQEEIDGTDPLDPCDPNADSEMCIPAVIVHAKMMLHGAYDELSGLMRDDLRAANLIPVDNPYAEFVESSHTGTERIEDLRILEVATPSENSIVDWVLIELRDAAEPATILHSRAALLQRDGDIVDLDGISPVQIVAEPTEYYIAVRHRNHLGAMTATPVQLTRTADEIFDFTDKAFPTWGEHARKIDEEVPVALLWSGNAFLDTQIIFQGASNDVDAIFFNIVLAEGNPSTDQNYINEGYYFSDTNMDGRVIFQGENNDIDFMIFYNVLTYDDNTDTLINYIVREQLP